MHMNSDRNTMYNNFSVAAARHLVPHEIQSGTKFPHSHVIDLRCDGPSESRAIEEEVLKRLANHHISYQQLPFDSDTSAGNAEKSLLELIIQKRGEVLVVTDQVSRIADFCQRLNIPFNSKSFYIVETGKGDMIRHVPAAPVFKTSFGNFAS